MWMWVGRNAIVAIAYFAAAKLALLLAIPPGYATAVWPSAGFAFVAALRWGPRITPGVVLGSLAANLPTSLSSDSAGRAFAVAGAIAAGAALQAYIGAALVRRAVPNHERLESERDILRFIAVGGPLGCLIAPTVGVSVLAASGAITDMVVFSWWTWWVGDAIGVVIFAPIVLAFIGRPRSVWAPRRSTVVVPLAMGLVLVTLLFARASRWETDTIETLRTRRTAVIAHAIAQQMAHYTDVARSIATLIDADPRLDRARFSAFALGAAARDPAIRGLGYNPRVTRDQRAAFEHQVRRELPAFEIWQFDAAGQRVSAGDADAYYPALYLEPGDVDPTILGYDFGAEPTRAEALAGLSERPDGVAVTGPLTLVQGARGFVVMTRVERGGVALLGIDARAFVDRAVGGLEIEDEEVAIVDVTGDGSAPVAGVPRGDASIAMFDVGGRRWQIAVAPRGPVARSWQAWFVLAGGLAFIAGLGTLLLIVTGRTTALAEAQMRYRDLYEHAPDMYITTDPSGIILDANATTRDVIGYGKEEIVGGRLADLAAGDAGRVDDASGASDLRLRRKDGTVIDASAHATAVRDETGQVIASRIVVRDISWRRAVDLDPRFLLELGDVLATSTSVAAVLRRASAKLADYLEVTRCWFTEIDLAAKQVIEHETFASGSRARTQAIAIGRVRDLALDPVLQGERVIIEDTSVDPRTGAMYEEQFAAGGIRAVVAIPLMRGGECAAYFAVISSRPRVWTQRELMLVQQVAERTWLWIENIELVERLRALSRDLEERVAQRTQELGRSEANFRNLIERAPAGVMVHVGDVIVYANAALLALLACGSVAEMLGRSCLELLHRDSAASAASLRDGDSTELWLARADGAPLCVRASAIPIEYDDQAAVLVMFRDITVEVAAERELRESEGRYRQLFDESPIALWQVDFSSTRSFLLDLRAQGIVDLDTHLAQHRDTLIEAVRRMRILAVNEAALDLHHAKSQDALVADLPALFGEDTFEMFRREILALLAGAHQFETETTTRTLDGDVKSISARLSVIAGHELTWSRVVVSYVDLTLSKQVEAQLRAALLEKESLLLEIHHRVKNNLQIVSSLINLQARMQPDPRLVAAFAETQQRIQSIALVHEQLYRSKNLARIAIDEYIETLVANLLHAHGASTRGIVSALDTAKVQVPIGVALPCGLIVNELVTNALKYAFPDNRSGQIEIALRERHGEIELVVADDGIGLPSDVDPRTAKTLGLDLVFTFAEQLGAAVAVDGTNGTTFRFNFRPTA